jgi:hypothetical protein
MTSGSKAALLPAMRSHLAAFVAKMQRSGRVNPRIPPANLRLSHARNTIEQFLVEKLCAASPQYGRSAGARNASAYGATSGASSRLKAAMIAGIGCGIGGTS